MTVVNQNWLKNNNTKQQFRRPELWANISKHYVTHVVCSFLLETSEVSPVTVCDHPLVPVVLFQIFFLTYLIFATDISDITSCCQSFVSQITFSSLYGPLHSGRQANSVLLFGLSGHFIFKCCWIRRACSSSLTSCPRVEVTNHSFGVLFSLFPLLLGLCEYIVLFVQSLWILTSSMNLWSDNIGYLSAHRAQIKVDP